MGDSGESMAVFKGVFDRLLDEKNRLPIAAPFRKILEYEFLNNPERTLELRLREDPLGFAWLECLTNSFVNEEIENALKKLTPRTEEWMVFWLGEKAKSVTVNLDAQGRILIPQPYLERAKITKQCKLAGMGTYFTIWAPEQWELFQQMKCTQQRIDEVLRKVWGLKSEQG